MKPLFATLALLVLACAPLRAQQAETLRVDVKLVNVFASVTDPSGRPVANLAKDEFLLFEDGRPQQLSVFSRESELPLSIVLQIDASLSTRMDMKLEMEAARRFLKNIVRPVDAVSVFQFNENVDQLVPFTSDLKRLDRALKRVTLGGGTAVYDALYLGAEVLYERQGRKVLVLISDGGDTVSKTSYAQALRAAQEAEAIVYSVIIVPIAANAGRNLGGENALIQISSDTGGKHYYANNIGDLDAAFREISEELRTQYLLAYYPDKKMGQSSFRRIEVRVKEKGEAANLIVRHRAGYYSSKPR